MAGVKAADAEQGSGRGGARSGPHTQLVAACLEWLGWRGIWARKMNTGAFRTESGGFVRAAFPG